MRKEYWSPLWKKIHISCVAAAFLSVASIGILSGKMVTGIELVIVNAFVFLFGAYFAVNAFVMFKWPIFITENGRLVYRGAFGILHIYSNLTEYRVRSANNGMYLYDTCDKKYGLSTGRISKKQHDDLYSHITQYAKQIDNGSVD